MLKYDSAVLKEQGFFMQASLVALVAALAGIVLERFSGTLPFMRIIGDALIMGAFIIAITAFLLFVKNRFFGTGQDEILWTSRP
jgi:F0F1-type ATP synthase assembly protein I